MATCNDCIHSGICAIQLEPHYVLDRTQKLMRESNNVEHECLSFKDRSRFVELPCVAGEYVYVIEPIFGKSIEHTISRRKIKSIEPHAEIKFYGGWIHDCLSGFGRYIFSTYEAAEQALKERIENDA